MQKKYIFILSMCFFVVGCEDEVASKIEQPNLQQSIDHFKDKAHKQTNRQYSAKDSIN